MATTETRLETAVARERISGRRAVAGQRVKALKPRDLRRWLLSFVYMDLGSLEAEISRIEQARAAETTSSPADLGYVPPAPWLTKIRGAKQAPLAPAERRRQELQRQFVQFCLAPLRVNARRRQRAMKIWPIGVSEPPPPTLEFLQGAQKQWIAFLDSLCDAPVGKAVRLRALELVPVIVKSAPIVRATPKPGPATDTAIHYRPRAFDESFPGYASLLFLFADRAHLIRRCADAKCGRLYLAERIDRQWCSDKCRIGKAVERFRATKREGAQRGRGRGPQ